LSVYLLPSSMPMLSGALPMLNCGSLGVVSMDSTASLHRSSLKAATLFYLLRTSLVPIRTARSPPAMG
jgi:hypothetical protein